jgi:mono/diheme cytochrome c family protein
LKLRIVYGVAAALAVLIAIQFVRVPRTNPPVESEVAWDSPRTRELFFRACADCHSHETSWPWYSAVAPVSWLVADHVRTGRLDMNISLPDEVDVTEAVKQIRSGRMPPLDYRLMHPEARLNEDEKTELISGLKKTF